MNRKSMKTVGISGFIALILIFLDQFTKYLASTNLKGQNPLVLMEGVLEFRYLENQSAAFSLDLVSIFQKIFQLESLKDPEHFLKVKMTFFAVFTIIVVIALIIIYLRVPETKHYIWINGILILFVAGAIGNLIDRIVNNYVVDFVYFKLIDFPVFNVADIYVTVAVFGIILFGIFYYKESDFEEIFGHDNR